MQLKQIQSRLPYKEACNVQKSHQKFLQRLLVLSGPTRARILQQEESLRKEWVDNPAA